jgi:LmbE family N-acetylglucosaminyl deacetylase
LISTYERPAWFNNRRTQIPAERWAQGAPADRSCGCFVCLLRTDEHRSPHNVIMAAPATDITMSHPQASTHSIVRKSVAFTMLTTLAILVAVTARLRPQVRAEYDLGAIGLQQSLLRLQTTASVLHTGAHPDDEDSALIARLAQGDHARVAYLSLNRGEGGQNTIGPELFEPLGVIRTEELLQARRLDGGEQLFTRAFDVGFSKTRAETASLWGEETILDDMVRAIRTFRPLIVISRFSGTPADGHGHHQFAGYLTPIAVARAADPAAFPEQLAEGLRPWRTLKLYVSEGLRPSGDVAATLRLDTGHFDPVLGRSYFEIAMEGRSQHRSQHQGALELRGERTTGVRLLKSDVSAAPTESLSAGIDTSIAGIARLSGAPAGTLRAELAAIQSSANRALSAFTPLEPGNTVPLLVEGLQALHAAQALVEGFALETPVKAELTFRLNQKASDLEDTITRAAGLVIDPLADRETVAAGETMNVAVRTFFPPGGPIRILGAQLHAPNGWSIDQVPPPDPPGGGAGRLVENVQYAAHFRVLVPPTAAPTQPYWLTEPRKGAVFAWPDGTPKGLPFAPALLEAWLDVSVAGATMRLRRPVEFRTADPARGELRRRVDVVPALSVAVNEPLVIVPWRSRPSEREVVVRTENLTTAPVDGTVTLQVPNGWNVRPRESPFSLEAAGERAIARFTIVIPGATAERGYPIQATAAVGDRRYQRTLHTIAYPHIQTHRLYAPATVNVRVMRLAVPTVNVGYVMGTGDDVPAAIRLMGVPVTLLDSDALTSGDLTQFDTIVIGIRASEARPDFVANHKRLLQWVQEGGALIVQYQQPDYVDRKLPPFPVRVGARVTDERARVTILEPDHPAFTMPNPISADDWSDWVQERTVNNWSIFDPKYTALLESHDPGDSSQRGGEVLARIGRGVYVYSAYAWFRQLPAGVPGAYRLFANLLALGQPHRSARTARASRARH